LIEQPARVSELMHRSDSSHGKRVPSAVGVSLSNRYNGEVAEFGGRRWSRLGLAEALLEQYGYVALLIILFLDSAGVPWPTEATLVIAGSAAKSPLLVLLAGLSSLAGAAVGCSLSYYLGRRIGPSLMQRVGAFFRLSPATLQKVDDWFERHGHRAVFYGRFIPFVRSLIGYPGGVLEVPFGKYLLFSLAGYGLYIAFALSLGFGGKTMARLIGDLEIFLAILVPIAAIVVWFKWGRHWYAKQRGKG
jgi:membrane protein DedA with SNARE-associated domain